MHHNDYESLQRVVSLLEANGKMTYYEDGRLQYDTGTGNIFHPNGQLLRNGGTGDIYYENGRMAKNASTGNVYDSTGTMIYNSKTGNTYGGLDKRGELFYEAGQDPTLANDLKN